MSLFSTQNLHILGLLNDARFVGGAVRDFLLKKKVEDIDIATSLMPEKVMKILQSGNIKVVPTGLKHGTVTAIYAEKTYEITTLRKDEKCDGRHAKVKFTDSWEEDAARRDFTINAMFLDKDKKIYDYFGGEKDLKKGVVKFVGDPEKRIKEDYLRILRLFRFYCFYGKGDLLESVLNLCKKYSSKISSLAGERISSEMLKIFSNKNYPEIVFLIRKYGLDKDIFGFDLSDKTNFLKTENNWLNLKSVLRDKENLEIIAEKWVLSKRQVKYLSDLFDMENQNYSFENLVSLQKMVFDFGHDLAKDYSHLKLSEQHELLKKTIKQIEEVELLNLPLNGEDIKKLGFKQGKEIGIMMAKAKKIWEESEYKFTKEEIIASL